MKHCFTFPFVFFGPLLSLQMLSAQPQSAPCPRSGFSLAFDSNRGVVVLFGGQDSANGRLGDTWEWGAGGWNRVEVTGPAARMNAPMTYDTKEKRIFLFGGRTESGVDNGLWTYDGHVWKQADGALAPAPRQLATMVYDKKAARLVLFGGMDANKAPLGDTWFFKDGHWSSLPAGSGPSPSPRSSQAMTYDDALDAVILYGGYINSAASSECWILKDGDWKDWSKDGGPPRIHGALVYDSDKQRVLLFGGFNEQKRTNELWAYSDHRWNNLTGIDDKTPAPRAEHRCVFIPGQGLFLFGGVIGPDADTRKRGNDTWLFDGAWRHQGE
jgi:hypothetical protein